MIDLRLLDKRGLREYIYADEYDAHAFIAISRHRALSHLANPRADADDVLLLLAYEGEDLVGYLGVLPDQIYYRGSFHKCGWLSCLWVDPKHRGKKIAYVLVQKSIEIYERRILVTEFTGAAGRLYDRTNNFVPLTDLRGLRFYRRFHLSKVLPPKNRFWKKKCAIVEGSRCCGQFIARPPIHPKASTPSRYLLQLHHRN